MNQVELKKVKRLQGEITPPPDKSISHRAVMFSALAQGKSVVRNFLAAEDPLSTLSAMKALGVDITREQSGEVIINGKGLHALKEPFDVLDCGNSGTTIRLLSGILSGNPFFSVLTGDDSLKSRPMARIITPLRQMGASLSGRDGDKYPPLAIKGGNLKAIEYALPVASAQVKSCLMLAALYAEGTTTLTEPHKSRDHTERMLKAMGAAIEENDTTVKVTGGNELSAIEMSVPADFSSAAFFIAATLMMPDSEVLIKNVGNNPTRTGFLKVLEMMGAHIVLEHVREVSGEPVADIFCTTPSSLKAVTVDKDMIPSIIDEFPILCVLATQAEGATEIRGAEELRVKESDRIKAMATELRKMGAELEEYPDGIAIQGKARLTGAEIESYHDHRIAMSFAIAALVAEGTTTIKNASCVDISFPGFFEQLKKLAR